MSTPTEEITRAISELDAAIAHEKSTDAAVVSAQLRLHLSRTTYGTEQDRLVREAKQVLDRYQDWLASEEVLPQARDLLTQALAA